MERVLMQPGNGFVGQILHCRRLCTLHGVGGELSLHFIEGRQMRLLMLLHLDNVIAVRGFHETAGLSRLE